MGRRRTFIIGSLIAIGISLAAMIFPGFKWGIDFSGGTEIQVSFKEGVTSAQVRAALSEFGFPTAEVVTFGASESQFLVRLQAISSISDELTASSEKAFKTGFPGVEVSRFEFSPGGDKLTVRVSKQFSIAEIEKAVQNAGLTVSSMSAEEQQALQKETAAAKDKETDEEQEESSKVCESMTCTWPHQDTWVYETNLKGLTDRIMQGFHTKDFGNGAVKMRSEWVGPKVGQQLRTGAVMSLTYAFLFIMLYVAFRFDFRFAPGGVIALIHDVIITTGVLVLARVEITMYTIAALLTIVGYSINDTIVIYDRIRENLGKTKERDLVQVINTSVNETMSRTILTSFATQLAVICLMVIGWKTSIRDFAFTLFVGMIAGVYSTVFIASPIVVWLDQKFYKKKA